MNVQQLTQSLKQELTSVSKWTAVPLPEGGVSNMQHLVEGEYPFGAIKRHPQGWLVQGENLWAFVSNRRVMAPEQPYDPEHPGSMSNPNDMGLEDLTDSPHGAESSTR